MTARGPKPAGSEKHIDCVFPPPSVSVQTRVWQRWSLVFIRWNTCPRPAQPEKETKPLLSVPDTSGFGMKQTDPV